MSRITSTGITTGAGLISGIPIEETVNQLIALSARPRDLLANRTQGLRTEQSAIDQLSARVLSLQFSTDRFSASSVFAGRSVASSSDAVGVSVASGATPALGSYQFTPLQTASAHQLVSGTFSDLTDSLGDGVLRFGFGGHVDKGIDLAELNGSAGVTPGEIKITDKNGDSAVIDLRAAQTLDDVLVAINSSVDINVTAAADGDSLKLTDNTGSSGTLSVRDVGLGSTASDLGLTDLTASGATTEITGRDIYYLSDSARLATLNDGLGVRISSLDETDDLVFTLQDGTTDIGVSLTGATTLGDVVEAINADEDLAGKVTAAISADGRRLELTDSTAGAGTFTVADGATGSAATDLGLTQTAAGGVITGSRLVSGLQDTLVSTLDGGQGYTLGDIAITDRSGASATVDLSTAETLGEAVDLINAAGLGVTARVNDARSGIAVTDTTGAIASNLIIADSGATTTATDLGLVVDAAVLSIDGGSLNRQTISEATALSSLNGGAGIDLGDFRVTDSAGAVGAVDLNTLGSEAETVGDVIDRINALELAGTINVTAAINATGDGIELTDTAGGSGTLTVAEVGNGTTAADLNLVGASTTTNGDGQQTIDGSFRFEVDLSNLESSSEGVSLTSLNGGSGIDDKSGFIIADASADGNGNGTAFINLGEPGNEAFTISDVIDKINNAAGVSVTAAINEAGTGIVLTDTSGGDGTLEIREAGSNGTSAADLGLLGESSTTDDLGQPTIDSGFLFSAEDAEASALDTLVERINDLDAGVTASVLTDLNGSRLVLSANNTGAANELLVDTGASSLAFTETSRPTDAAALFGPAGNGGVVVRSESNDFTNIIDGLSVTLNQATGVAATIDVTADDGPALDAAQDFVDAYNSLRASLDDFTSFDEESLTTGILFGRTEALRVDSDLSRVLTSRLVFNNEFGSLDSVGISLDGDGRLSLDRAKFSEAYAKDTAAVERLFTDEQNGAVTRLTTAIDQLAGDENSLLSSRSEALNRTIETNDQRIESLTESLELERERLLLEFIRLEETIALLQSNNTAIESIQPIQIQTRSSTNN